MPKNSKIERGLTLIVLVVWLAGMAVYVNHEWYGPARTSHRPSSQAFEDAEQLLTSDEMKNRLNGMNHQIRGRVRDHEQTVRMAQTTGKRPTFQTYFPSETTDEASAR